MIPQPVFKEYVKPLVATDIRAKLFDINEPDEPSKLNFRLFIPYLKRYKPMHTFSSRKFQVPKTGWSKTSDRKRLPDTEGSGKECQKKTFGICLWLTNGWVYHGENYHDEYAHECRWESRSGKCQQGSIREYVEDDSQLCLFMHEHNICPLEYDTEGWGDALQDLPEKAMSIFEYTKSSIDRRAYNYDKVFTFSDVEHIVRGVLKNAKR